MPLFVVVPDPTADHRSGLAQKFEPMLPNAFFDQGPEEALEKSVFLRGVGRREFLGEPVGLLRLCIVPTAEGESDLREQGQRLMNSAQCAESMYQGLFQRRFSRILSAGGSIGPIKMHFSKGVHQYRICAVAE